MVFVDVTNFTAASRTLDSEEVFVWMDETMRVLAEVIQRYEGTIDKYTGDGLMALFGAPVAHENDPELAVRSGLTMQSALEPLREQIRESHGIDFQVRIGINTGSVVAGNLGGEVHAEYTVLGDAVNVAARLEKAAEPGTVLVSTSTYERTAALFHYQPMAPILVKGVPEPLVTYRPLGVEVRLATMRGLPGLRAVMVGRDEDLHVLHTIVAALGESGRSRVAAITGEAGLGKSRLVAELSQIASAGPIRYIQAVCLAHTRSTPLWIIADLIRDIAGLTPQDGEAAQRDQLQAYLATRDLLADDLLPFLLHALSLDTTMPEFAPMLRALDPLMLQNQTHAAVRQLLLAEAARQPCVLVLDDLHWLDQASQSCLEYLLQTTSDAPIAMVLVARESARATTIERLIAAAPRDIPPVADVRLAALSEEQGRLLIAELLGNSSEAIDAVVAMIVSRAEGNPFYIEELIRMLIDHGGLVAVDGSWHATPQSLALLSEVPLSLQSLVLARFDQLPAGHRSALQRAAVLGRSFPATLIDQLGDVRGEGMLPVLRDLAERQYLVDEIVGAERWFAFQHTLVQDAIYGTIMRRDRQQLHDRAAALIEDGVFRTPDEQAEALAYHYMESQHADRAIPLLMQIADGAARRYANETAIQRYRQAITLMQTSRASYGLAAVHARIGLGRALKFAGALDEAAYTLGEAIDRLYLISIDRSTWLDITTETLGELADVRFRAGALEQAVAHLEQGLAVLGAVGPTDYAEQWRSLMNRLAYTRLRQGDLERAHALASEATRDIAGARDVQTLASLYGTLGGIAYEQGRLTEAAQYVEQSLDLFERLNYPWGMANCYTNLGILYYAQGLWQRAVESFSRSDTLRKEIGYMIGQALNRTNLGLLHMALGLHTQAQADFATSLAISRRLGDDYGVVRATLGMAHLAIVEQRYSDASASISAAEALLGAAGEDEAIQVRWMRALTLAAAGEQEGGEQLAAEALVMARSSGIAEQEVESLRALGHLQRLAGKQSAARETLTSLVAISEQRDDPYQHGLALLELGQLELDSDATGVEGRAVARGILEQANQLFDQLGAAHELQIVTRALAQLA